MKKPIRIPISDEEEFVKLLISRYKRNEEASFAGLSIEGIEFNYDFEIPFREEENYHNFFNEVGTDQQKLIMLYEYHSPLVIKNCEFNGKFNLGTSISCNILIENCIFNGLLNFRHRVFNGKLKVRNCHFRYVDFYNTVFNELVDFYKCHFHKRVVFCKTDFHKITVFSASIFYQNVLFTYALIEKLVIFRGTLFNKGLDLSTSIGQGAINSFGIKLKNFKTLDIKVSDHAMSESIYDRYITKSGVITTRNKRETFRILKHNLVSQSNISESIDFKVEEKETLRQELKIMQFRQETEGEKYYWYKKLSFDIGILLDRINLFLNRWSNNYGKSFGRALLFVLCIGWFFFYCSLIATDSYQFSIDPCKWEFQKGLEYFVQFLLPTHKFDYMAADEVILTPSFYVLDFLGRLFVGYGIYQFIQAFRKYR